jgi:hypothetical protein
MHEKTVDVRTVRKHALCDDCGGEMKFTNYVLTIHPPKYRHRCEKCEATENFDTIYPFIEYFPQGDSSLP